ncbi:MAG: DUF5060 domain-containing protein [Kiritimatiellae bacterium]|nr:DUF5060 domain-containing protein [Kiritimatiellia bacterium]
MATAQINVERWDTHTVDFRSTPRHTNPFTDVEFKARFGHEASGRECQVDGFHDGADTWRVRFMPSELGTWRYVTESNDPRLDKRHGSLQCVAPKKNYLHGPLCVDGLHFKHADGTRRFLISTRLSCPFAPPAVLDAVIAFLQANRINRVLFIMGGVAGTIRELYGGDLDFSTYNVAKFRAIDAFIDRLRRADILASPYFYYFNDGDQRGMTLEQDKAYVRYGMARFGAYANVMPCLSNQVEGKYSNSSRGQYDPRNHPWGNEMGAYLAGKAVFGVPVTVHNPLENQTATEPSFYTLLRDWPFPWADFMLRQAQVGALGGVAEFSDSVPEQSYAGAVEGAGGAVFPRFYNPRAFANHNRLMIELRRFGIPIINEEPGYEMKGMPGNPRRKNIAPKTWNSQTSESLLPTFWTAAMAGAYCMWGSLETYCLDDPLPGMQNSVTPQYLRVLHDFMSRLPYWEMQPENDAVSPNEIEIEGKPWRTNFCLAKSGEVYLIFSLYGQDGRVRLPNHRRFDVNRVNPRTGEDVPLGTREGGEQAFALPNGEWVLLYRRRRK